MASTSWDPQGEAQEALRTIVADSQFGPAALSSSQTMTNLLKDLLPDAPRESSVLIAASDAGVPGSLQGYIKQGMPVETASRLAVGSFENRTALTWDACTWAVGALVSALRLDVSARPGPVRETVPPADNQRTMSARVLADRGRDPSRAASSSSRPNELRFPAASVAVLGAILIIWACALPMWTVSGVTGRSSFSIFNSGSGGGLWSALEPVGVAVLAVVAAMLLLTAARGPWLRWLTAGALIAFGVHTVFLFVGYQAGIPSPGHPAGAAIAGIFGGLSLLTAGVLAAVNRESPVLAASRS